MKLDVAVLLFGGLLLMLAPVIIAVARSRPWRPENRGGDGGSSYTGGAGYDSDGGGDGGGGGD